MAAQDEVWVADVEPIYGFDHNLQSNIKIGLGKGILARLFESGDAGDGRPLFLWFAEKGH